LAVSLHSARDEVRNTIMPINLKNPLSQLEESLRYWYAKTGRKVTYEYVVWKDINDRKEDIEALVKFCRIIPCKVNLIEYNPIDDGQFQQAGPEVLENYIYALKSAGIIAKV